MSHVILYICEATFDGNPGRDYKAPEKGQTVDCLLFLRQEARVEDLEGAEMALKEYLRTYRLTVEMYLEIVQQVAGDLKGMLDRCIVNTELW